MQNLRHPQSLIKGYADFGKKRSFSRREAYKCTSNHENGDRKSPSILNKYAGFHLLTVSFTVFAIFEFFTIIFGLFLFYQM